MKPQPVFRLLCLLFVITVLVSACAPVAPAPTASVSEPPTSAPAEAPAQVPATVPQPTEVPPTAVPFTEAPSAVPPTTAPAAAPTAAPVAPVVVHHAGSLLGLVTSISPGFTAETGIPVVNKSGPSVDLANAIRDGAASPDIFMSADADANALLMGPANNDRTAWFFPVARTRMVLAYSPQSKFKADFEAAAAGTKHWYEVLQSKDLVFKRNDPRSDPAGYRAVMMMQLAEDFYKVPGLKQAILGEDNNEDQIATGIYGNLKSGKIDASIIYLTSAIANGLPYIQLPDEIDLSNLTMAEQYAKASYKNPKGQEFVGTPALYSVTIPKAAKNPQGAEAFVKYLLSDKGKAAFEKLGFLPAEVLVGGDKNAVPTGLQEYVKGEYKVLASAAAPAAPAPTPTAYKRIGPKELILSTTTSTRDSGLLDVLLPLFEKATGYTVKMIAVGSGQALKMGEQGNADVLLVHAPKSEEDYMSKGFGKDRLLVMHNDFIIIGPAEDPAGIKGLKDPAEAFKKIADAQQTFVTRADDSGTNKAELAIWAKAGYVPTASDAWYLQTGQGMGETLRITSELGGYTLTDRATYLALKDKLQFEILVEGDKSLLNIYHVITVSPDKWPDVNYAGAKAFADFLVSPEIQKVIAEFGADKYPQPLFYPDAGKNEADLGK